MLSTAIPIVSRKERIIEKLMPRRKSKTLDPLLPDQDFVRIQLAKLSQKRQEVIRPVLENPSEYVLLSIHQLAERTGSNPATVLRAIRELGFGTGFKQFRRYLQELALINTTSFDAMHATGPASKGRAQAPHSKIQEISEQAMRNVTALRETIHEEQLLKIADRIYAAKHNKKRILVLGGDLAESPVRFLEYQLTALRLPVYSGTSEGRVVNLTAACREGDVVIAISFRRGLHQTVKGMRDAKGKGAFCVGITDTALSPIATFSDECLIVPTRIISFAHSYVALFALLDMLLVCCKDHNDSEAEEIMEDIKWDQERGHRWYNAREADSEEIQKTKRN